jgi:hypothetical protein
MMQSDMWVILLVLTVGSHCSSLSFDPDDYLEVYPDPTMQHAQGNTTPLYFALIQTLTGPVATNGTVAGVKVALDWINNDTSILQGYTLHYTLGDGKVKISCM